MRNFIACLLCLLTSFSFAASKKSDASAAPYFLLEVFDDTVSKNPVTGLTWLTPEWETSSETPQDKKNVKKLLLRGRFENEGWTLFVQEQQAVKDAGGFEVRLVPQKKTVFLVVSATGPDAKTEKHFVAVTPSDAKQDAKDTASDKRELAKDVTLGATRELASASSEMQVGTLDRVWKESLVVPAVGIGVYSLNQPGIADINQTFLSVGALAVVSVPDTQWFFSGELQLNAARLATSDASKAATLFSSDLYGGYSIPLGGDWSVHPMVGWTYQSMSSPGNTFGYSSFSSIGLMPTVRWRLDARDDAFGYVKWAPVVENPFEPGTKFMMEIGTGWKHEYQSGRFFTLSLRTSYLYLSKSGRRVLSYLTGLQAGWGF